MLLQHAGRRHWSIFESRVPDPRPRVPDPESRRDAHPPYDLAQHLDRHCTRPQDGRCVTRQVQHCRLDADRGRAAIDDEIDPPVEVVDDVGGLSRTGPREQVGARRGDGHGGRVDQGSRNGMRRHANRHVGKAGGHLVRHASGAREDHGQRPGPEVACEASGTLRHARNERRNRLERSHVDDERVVQRALLRREQPLYGRTVQGVHSEPVYGLRWKRDQPATAEAFGGAGNSRRVGVVCRDPNDVGHDAYIVVPAADSVHWIRYVRSGRSRAKAPEE